MITEFVINRAEWRRGKLTLASGNSLLNDDGTRCCLGILARACGIPDKCLLHVEFPTEVYRSERGKFPDFLLANFVERGIARINDSGALDESSLEEQLAAKFAEHGITVRFEG